MNICPNCGKEVDDNARHCGHCGHKLQIEQKKTMLGMAAIDPAELQKRIAEARPAGRGEERDADRPDGEVPDKEQGGGASPEMAQTEVMEPVRLPKPQGDSRAPVESEPAIPQDLDELSEAEVNDFATGPTQALEAISGPGAKQDAASGSDASDSAASDDVSNLDLPAQPTGPMEALGSPKNPDEGGQWDASKPTDPLAATELEMPVVDLSKSGQVDAGTIDAPASESPEDRSEVTPLTAVDEAPTGAPAELSPAPEQGLAQYLPDNLAQLADDPENKKRLILFVAAIAAVLLGCCVLSAVLSFML